VVRIGLKVDALDALQQEERCKLKYSSTETVGGGRGMQMGAELVFLQDPPPGPLIRAKRRDAPMSQCGRLVIRSDSTSLQNGLAARPSEARSRLACFETHPSGVRVVAREVTSR